MIKLAFGHKARSGKDSSAEYVNRRFGTISYRFASPVYDIALNIQKYLGKTQIKDPGLLQWVGTGLRDHYGNNIWVQKLINNCIMINLESPGVTVPDMRFKNELEALKANGFTTVKMNRSSRPIDRDPTHISEVDLDDGKFDYDICNDFAIESLYLQLNGLILAKFPKKIPAKYAISIEGQFVIHSNQCQSGNCNCERSNFSYAEFSDTPQDCEQIMFTQLHKIIFGSSIKEPGQGNLANEYHLLESPRGDCESYWSFSPIEFKKLLAAHTNELTKPTTGEKIRFYIYNNITDERGNATKNVEITMKQSRMIEL